MSYTLYIPFLFAFGVAFGSFLTMLIPRIHDEEGGILTGRSHCFSCKKKLHIRDLVPLLSFLKNRGKCRFCSKKISLLYPSIEVVTGIMFVLIYMLFPFETLAEAPITIFYLLMSLILIFTFFYDLKYLEISDLVLLPGIVLALIGAYVFADTPDFLSAVVGTAIGAGFFLAQFLLSKGKWVGGGDFRIGAFMGALLGWQMVLIALVVSYLVGSVVSIPLLVTKNKKMGEKIPLGPFLVVGTFVALFYGKTLMYFYLGLL